MKRIAILMEGNNEIFRGSPSDLPVRFIDPDGGTMDLTMQGALNNGTPVDDQGKDCELVDE